MEFVSPHGFYLLTRLARIYRTREWESKVKEKKERYDVKDSIIAKQIKNCRVSLMYTTHFAPEEAH